MCSTPWTMTKFIKWQLRDWVSCFLACRFPMDDDDESEKFKNMVVEIKDDMRGNNRTLSSSRRQNRFRNGRQGINHDLTQERNRNSSTTNSNNNNVLVSLENMISNDSTSSSWPHFQEEDYIVFCFKEDGAFDVVKDCKSESFERFDSTNNRILRPVNRKLNYGEVAETVRKSSHGKRSNAHGNDAFLRNGERINPVEEGEEEQNSIIDIKSSSTASFSRYQSGEIENHGTVTVESSDSNQSESSTGSFSFPVSHWEPMGSPAQMPKSEGLYTRKHKLPCARFQCFRF